VVVADDDRDVRLMLRTLLELDGHEVVEAQDGDEAWQLIMEYGPSVVVADIQMPGLDGLQLCRKIRAASETVPIIFLTSRDEELDRVVGLELGADDYLGKPFSMRELIARIRVLFRRAARRASGNDETVISVGSLDLDPHRFLVRWKGHPIDLTVTEFLMLQALVRHPGHVKTRQQLTREGYPHDNYVSERTIDSHVKRIRKKFEAVDPQFDRIDTVYGMGYRYQPEAT